MKSTRLGRPGRPGLFFALPAAALLALSGGCKSVAPAEGEEGWDMDYRQEMRTLVVEIGEYAREVAPSFLIIPQNGEELITTGGKPEGALAETYVAAIDGQGREDLFYGYRRDNAPTPEEATAWISSYLDRAAEAGVVPLVTDYVADPGMIDDSYRRNRSRGYRSFAAPNRELDVIPSYPPSPPGSHIGSVSSLQDARNFLYLLNPERFDSREAYLLALDGTGYDLLIIDAFYGSKMLTEEEVNALQTKPGGGRRLVLAYLSIGEAEEYRYYWRASWQEEPPHFLVEENPNWPGNHTVRYWESEWKAVLFGSPEAYLDRILSSGFDGTYLDIIDAYEQFE